MDLRTSISRCLVSVVEALSEAGSRPRPVSEENRWKRGPAASKFAIGMVVLLQLSGCGGESESGNGLTAEELAAEAPAQSVEDPPVALPPIEVADAKDFMIIPLLQNAYFDAEGRYGIDVFQHEFYYLAVRLETLDGRPVKGAELTFSLEGTSQLLEPIDISPLPTTNHAGEVEFAVIGGDMGLDRITVEFKGAHTKFVVNVISQAAFGFAAIPEVEGGISWDELMQAKVTYGDEWLTTTFPDSVMAKAGQTVKVAGFMTPLEADMKQRRFVLTSNPPSCFYHVPGGPAGAVEVYAPEGVEVLWDPVVLEGRFEAHEKSENGVIYQLHDARLVTP